MNKWLLLVTLCLATGAASGQPVEKRTFVYAVKGADTLRLDRYEVSGSDGAARPCLMFAFGGGFVSGTRDDARYLPYFEYFARRGYVVVSADYRLGLKNAFAEGPLDEGSFPQAFAATVALATEDFYDATGYVAAHGGAWRVDPACIVASGSSAGAITVLMCEYGICNDDPAAVRKLPQNFNYAGVISYAGAIFDTHERLRWKRMPAPLMLFHGDADRNVPYGVLAYGGFGLFGSEAIARELTKRRVPHWFYSVEGADHAMATRPLDDNRYEIDAFLLKLVREHRPLMVDTRVASTEAVPVPKAFTLSDYVRANFGA